MVMIATSGIIIQPQRRPGAPQHTQQRDTNTRCDVQGIVSLLETESGIIENCNHHRDLRLSASTLSLLPFIPLMA